MRCPHCASEESRVLQTFPSKSREDGQTRRRRKCLACHQGFNSVEMELSEATSARPGFAANANPLPTIPSSLLKLIDIESEMESLLLPSIAALHEALAAKDQASAPAKVKVDTARWVVSDRREHRRSLAQAMSESKVTTDDPAMMQLIAAMELIDAQEEN